MQQKKKTFGKSARRHMLFFHVLFTALWIGAGLSMQLDMFLKNPQNISELFAFNMSVKIIDDFIIIASGMGTLLTGLLLSWKTHWGFFKHWWIAIKLILTVLVIVTGITYLGPWTNASVSLVETIGNGVRENAEYLNTQFMVKTVGMIQLTIIVFMLYLSVIKPFGKLAGKKSRNS
jgi:hypothetical protein